MLFSFFLAIPYSFVIAWRTSPCLNKVVLSQLFLKYGNTPNNDHSPNPLTLPPPPEETKEQKNRGLQGALLFSWIVSFVVPCLSTYRKEPIFLCLAGNYGTSVRDICGANIVSSPCNEHCMGRVSSGWQGTHIWWRQAMQSYVWLKMR